MDLQDVPFNEQMALNIEKKRLDKIVRRMENEGEERKKFMHDNYPKLADRIKARVKVLSKAFCGK